MTNAEDSLLQLSFVPAWARTPPSRNIYAGRDEPDPQKDRPSMRDRRHDRPRHENRNRRRGKSDRCGKDVGPERRQRPRAALEPSQLMPPADLSVQFIPERHGLKPLSALLARTGKAYPLMEIAAMFLEKPDYFAVKIEVLPRAGAAPGQPQDGTRLTQCAECLAVYMDRAAALAHAFNAHFDKFYFREELTVEPPKGNFTCVARCGLSGELLGPPNYHGFSERVREMHKTHYSNMSLDEYRSRIVNDTDPAKIEEWKQLATRRTVIRVLGSEPALTFQRMTEAESHFVEHHARNILREGSRFILPGPVSVKTDDPRIRLAIQQAWNREIRFPLRMSLALRPAFKHHGLHLFRVSERAVFVSSISPNPIEPAQASETVQRILTYLLAHPGSTRHEVIAGLLPGAALDSPAVTDIVSCIRWLTEKGHMIEFFDGKLSVPHPASKNRTMGRDADRGRPSEEHSGLNSGWA